MSERSLDTGLGGGPFAAEAKLEEDEILATTQIILIRFLELHPEAKTCKLFNYAEQLAVEFYKSRTERPN